MSTQPDIEAIVINLASAHERWSFQEKQLKHLGISYKRFEAVSVDDLTDDEYEKWANSWQRKLRRTEVACFLSHYRIWEYIAKNQKSFLILEDDALLSEKISNALQLIKVEKSISFDHLTFETRARKKMISKKPTFKAPDFSFHDLFLDKTGAAAYILTPKGAQKLLNEVALNGAGLADALLCHTKTLNKLQVVPALAIQMDMATHYDMPELKINSVAKSNISTKTNNKPQPNNLSDKLHFKTKRIGAQLDMGFVQLKNNSKSNYLDIKPNKDDFAYLISLLKD